MYRYIFWFREARQKKEDEEFDTPENQLPLQVKIFPGSVGYPNPKRSERFEGSASDPTVLILIRNRKDPEANLFSKACLKR